MTVEYGSKPRFYKLLVRWYGSAWKAIYKELLLWLLAYYIIRFGIKYGCKNEQMVVVEGVVKLFDIYTARIPLEFLLGFYVTQVVTRWWNHIVALVSPAEVMSALTAYMPDNDPESRRIRHSVARHLIQFYVLAYRKVSKRMQTLFPNNDKFIAMGLMTAEESGVIEALPQVISLEQPLQWAQTLIREKVGNHGRIIDAFMRLRGSSVVLSKHNKFQLPLVYSQTVTIIVYGYFVFALIGHQFFNADHIDIYFPFFTVLRFIFTVGWLKVAEDLFFPFGNDDEDIDLCLTLSSFTTVAFAIADMPEYNTVLMDQNCKDDLYNVAEQRSKIKEGFDADVLRHKGIPHKLSMEFSKLHRTREPDSNLL